MRNILLACVAAFSVVLLAGCAPSASEDRGRLAVTYTVLKFVESADGVEANDVLAAVDKVRTVLDAEQTVAAGDLEATIVGAVDLPSLSPADRFLALEIIRQVVAGVDAEVEVGVVPENYGATLRKWMEWIESAAVLAGGER